MIQHFKGRALRGGFALGAGLWLFLQPVAANAIKLTIDYRFDASGFFDAGTRQGQEARDRLDDAARFYSDLIGDSLDAIEPGRTGPGTTNSWTGFFTNPSNGGASSTANLSIGADEILVFAGARDLGGNILGNGGFGGSVARGDPGFVDGVASRGQAGVGVSDFAPWGGSISFDSVGTDWHLRQTSVIPRGRTDFYSVALHELAHVLGLGTSGSWNQKVAADAGCASGLSFAGANAVAVNGGVVCLEDLGHFQEGLRSGGQEVAMDPTLGTQIRKELTPLDLAALKDVGWELVPEPAGLLCLAGAGFLALRRIRAARSS